MNNLLATACIAVIHIELYKLLTSDFDVQEQSNEEPLRLY